MAIRDDTVDKISKKTKVSRTSLYKWKNELVSPILENKIKDNSLSELDELKNEVARLKKDIYRLTMEKDVLEKATELLKKTRALILII